MDAVRHTDRTADAFAIYQTLPIEDRKQIMATFFATPEGLQLASEIWNNPESPAELKIFARFWADQGFREEMALSCFRMLQEKVSPRF